MASIFEDRANNDLNSYYDEDIKNIGCSGNDASEKANIPLIIKNEMMPEIHSNNSMDGVYRKISSKARKVSKNGAVGRLSGVPTDDDNFMKSGLNPGFNEPQENSVS
jgi:hypothetical protein